MSKKVIIYGAGITGVCLYNFLTANGYKVKFFIDQYTSQKNLFGLPIFRIHEVSEKDIPVYIGVSYDNEEIKRSLKENGFKKIIPYEYILKKFNKKELKTKSFPFNVEDYWKKDEKILKSFLNSCESISFDIFDTIIVRKVVYPKDVFKLVEVLLPFELREKIKNFAEIRENIENELKLKFKKEEITIHEIYKEISKKFNLTHEQINLLIELEVFVEKNITTLRGKLNCFLTKLVKSEHKKICFTSDTYFTSSEIREILKDKIPFLDKITLNLSSETGLRKAGSFWYFYGKNINCHIGDDWVSDAQKPEDAGVKSFLLLSPLKLLEFSKNISFELPLRLNFLESLAIGHSLVKLFSDPFCLKNTKGYIKFENPYLLGYVVFGPVFLKVILSILKKVYHGNYDIVIFLARDGFIPFKCLKIFSYYFKKDLGKFPKLKYLLASTVSLQMFLLKTKEDVLNLKNYFYLSDLKDFFLVLSEEKECDNEITEENIEKLLILAEKQRELYLKYLKKLGVYDKKKILIIDIGISGTIQICLQKILNLSNIEGLYFFTRKDKTKVKAEPIFYDLVNFSEIYNKKNVIDLVGIMNTIGAILTAPRGQFLKFSLKTKNLMPIYKKHALNEVEMNKLKTLWQGVLGYIKNVAKILQKLSISVDVLIDTPFSNEVSLFFLNNLILNHSTMLSKDLKELFKFDIGMGRNEKLVKAF